MNGVTFGFYMGKCKFQQRIGRLIFFADTQDELYDIIRECGTEEEVTKVYENLFEYMEDKNNERF